MKFERLSIPDIILIEPKAFSDDRGWFSEAYNQKVWRDGGVTDVFVQDNEALSNVAGTIRGLHFQAPPHAQSKLMRCVAGSIFDVAIDIRRNSPTFGKCVTAEITAASRTQLFIPVGFAHGYCTLTSNTIVQYKVSSHYNTDSERGILWNDPALAIEWPTQVGAPVIAPRDAKLPLLCDLELCF